MSRYTKKNEQWSRVLDVIDIHIRHWARCQTLRRNLAETGVGDKLTEGELSLLEEFLKAFAQSLRREE